jgi:hypothetical protein
MARHSSDEAATAQLVTVSLMGAGIILAIIALVLVALVSELWRIFKAHAFTPGPASRWLWGALAGLCGLLLVAGILASNPSTTAYSLPIVCWSFFVFVLVCEVTDRRYRPLPVPIPKQLSLADVVSWEKPTQPQQPVSTSTQEAARGHPVSKAA